MAGIKFANPLLEESPAEQIQDTSHGSGYMVTVFNNEQNTYDEVMMILMVATYCDADEAYIETWEIDHLGMSVVHRASESTCNEVASVISTIGIKVEVRREWED